MGDVWYSRRPEVAEMARRVTMARVEQYRRMAADLRQAAGELPSTILEPGTGIPLAEILESVAMELEVRLSGGTVVNLAPGEPCPDPARCFEL